MKVRIAVIEAEIQGEGDVGALFQSFGNLLAGAVTQSLPSIAQPAPAGVERAPLKAAPPPQLSQPPRVQPAADSKPAAPPSAPKPRASSGEAS